MTPGPRGWIVLFCLALPAAWWLGYCQSERTYAHVAFETKGDKR